MNYENLLPDFLKKKHEDLERDPKLNEKSERITDFIVLIECVWKISSKEYQKHIWEFHENVNTIDSYDDTTMYFLEDVDNVFKAYEAGRVSMTDSQHRMLKKLYDAVDVYDSDLERPEQDKDIVKDPKWDAIRKLAKEVYEELTK